MSGDNVLKPFVRFVWTNGRWDAVFGQEMPGWCVGLENGLELLWKEWREAGSVAVLRDPAALGRSLVVPHPAAHDLFYFRHG